MGAGGLPRELTDDVMYAVWLPSGELVAIRVVGANFWIERPLGTTVYKTSAEWISDLRVSPNGENVAFVSHSRTGARVMVLDAHNAARALTSDLPACGGLAWTPSGSEIWYTAGDWAADTLRGAPLNGGGYEVYRSTGGMWIEDIGPDGTVLFTLIEEAGDISLLARSAPSWRNLAWFGDAELAALSDDGQLLAFSDGRSARSGMQILVRKTDGSPPKSLGEGYALDLSADRKTVLASRKEGLVLLPVGAGMPQGLPTPGLEGVEEGRLFRDAKRVVVVARPTDSRERGVFLLEVGSDAGARPISEAGLHRWPSIRLSPDERWVAALGADELPVLLPIAGGPAIRLPGLSREHFATPVGWSAA